MHRKSVEPTAVYQMAQHFPVDEYQAQGCQCGHGHGHAPAPVQNITIKQSDPWVRYIAIGFAGAGVGLLVFVSIVAMLIAAGVCALCVAVASRALQGLLSSKKNNK